jgi:hypothetical protein
MKRIVSHTDLTAFYYTELEGMYKPYAADKKAKKNWNVVKEKGLWLPHSVSLN